MSLKRLCYYFLSMRRRKPYIYIEINGKKYNANAENYFTALQNLRSILEKQGVQICCNGAARNVYPSPMLLSMGDGYMAYKLFKGSNASMANLVNIFDYDNSLEWCTVSEQRKFYQEWLDSLKGE